jgi:hypothetical protein
MVRVMANIRTNVDASGRAGIFSDPKRSDWLARYMKNPMMAPTPKITYFAFLRFSPLEERRVLSSWIRFDIRPSIR